MQKYHSYGVGNPGRSFVHIETCDRVKPVIGIPIFPLWELDLQRQYIYNQAIIKPARVPFRIARIVLFPFVSFTSTKQSKETWLGHYTTWLIKLFLTPQFCILIIEQYVNVKCVLVRLAFDRYCFCFQEFGRMLSTVY